MHDRLLYVFATSNIPKINAENDDSLSKIEHNTNVLACLTEYNKTEVMFPF